MQAITPAVVGGETARWILFASSRSAIAVSSCTRADTEKKFPPGVFQYELSLSRILTSIASTSRLTRVSVACHGCVTWWTGKSAGDSPKMLFRRAFHLPQTITSVSMFCGEALSCQADSTGSAPFRLQATTHDNGMESPDFRQFVMTSRESPVDAERVRVSFISVAFASAADSSYASDSSETSARPPHPGACLPALIVRPVRASRHPAR